MTLKQTYSNAVIYIIDFLSIALFNIIIWQNQIRDLDPYRIRIAQCLPVCQDRYLLLSTSLPRTKDTIEFRYCGSIQDSPINEYEQETYMRRALDLARLCRGRRHQSRVGAVLVYRDRIIGEGFHAAYGQPHAKSWHCAPFVLKDQGFIPDSTLFVTLEPCCVYGRTPPVPDLIIRERIKKVVISCLDKARGQWSWCRLASGPWRGGYRAYPGRKENTRHSSAMCLSVNNDLMSSENGLPVRTDLWAGQRIRSSQQPGLLEARASSPAPGRTPFWWELAPR